MDKHLTRILFLIAFITIAANYGCYADKTSSKSIHQEVSPDPLQLVPSLLSEKRSLQTPPPPPPTGCPPDPNCPPGTTCPPDPTCTTPPPSNTTDPTCLTNPHCPPLPHCPASPTCPTGLKCPINQSCPPGTNCPPDSSCPFASEWVPDPTLPDYTPPTEEDPSIDDSYAETWNRTDCVKFFGDETEITVHRDYFDLGNPSNNGGQGINLTWSDNLCCFHHQPFEGHIFINSNMKNKFFKSNITGHYHLSYALDVPGNCSNSRSSVKIRDLYHLHSFSFGSDSYYNFAWNSSTCSYERIDINNVTYRFYQYQVFHYSPDITNKKLSHRSFVHPPDYIWARRKIYPSNTITVKDSFYGECIDGLETIFTWSWMDLKYLANRTVGGGVVEVNFPQYDNFTFEGYTQKDEKIFREYEHTKFISHSCEKEPVLGIKSFEYYPDLCDNSLSSTIVYDEGRGIFKSNYVNSANPKWINYYTLYQTDHYLPDITNGKIHRAMCLNATQYDGPSTIYVKTCYQGWPERVTMEMNEDSGVFVGTIYSHSEFNSTCVTGVQCLVKMFYPYNDYYRQVSLFLSDLMTEFTQDTSSPAYFDNNDC